MRKQNPVFGPNRKNGGYILVTVLLILVLLMLILTLLLSVSSFDSKTASYTRLQTEARSNAKAGMELALARLQEELGPDQRISAPGALLDQDPATAALEEVRAPWLVGTWDSWQWDARSSSGAPDYAGEKTNRFRRWLVSSLDESDATNPDLPKSGFSGDTIQLVGKSTLGIEVIDDPAIVEAGLISMEPEESRRKRQGRLAWVCLDENIKARVDLPGLASDFAPTVGEQANLLSAAPRAGVSSVPGLESFSQDPEVRMRTLTNKTVALALDDTTSIDAGAPWFHDVTTWSAGLQVDVVDGGLKKDLSLAFAGDNLPSDLAGQKILFPPSHGISWDYLHQYARLWERTDIDNGYALEVLPPSSDPAVSRSPENEEYPLLPVMVRTQFAMSFMARHHGGWNNWYPGYKHLLWFNIDPVVTLWNPYNVPIRFDEFQITCRQLPLNFEYLINGNNYAGKQIHFLQQWVPGVANHKGGREGGLRDKTYHVAVKPDGELNYIELKPGEVRVFSPRLPMQFDWNNSRTASINVFSGFERDAGFMLDWLAPPWLPSRCRGVLFINPNGQNPDVVGATVRADETRPYPSAGDNGSVPQWDFYADFKIKTGGTLHPAGGIRIDYEDKLADVLIHPEKYPGQMLKAGRDTQEVELSDVNVNRKFPLCIFSVQLRTEQDSRFPQRMWDNDNPLTPFTETKSAEFQHPSHHLYELDLKPFTSWEDVPTIESKPNGEGYFGPAEFSDRGVSFATMSQVPITPLTSVTDLRFANLTQMPNAARFSNTIGNSRAHPMINSRSVATGDNVDWRYLLNDTLFDHFYFSGFDEQRDGIFPEARNQQKVIEDFLNATEPVADRRLRSRRGGKSTEQIKTELLQGDGYKNSAAYQVVEGMFNVNSTSVPAWEALLSGLKKFPAQFLDPNNGLQKDNYTEGTVFSRFTLPNSPAWEKFNPEDDFWGSETAKWQGYRRLSSEQVHDLAEAIVKEVKERGPFLSMSHFVNREVGSPSEKTLQGAVEAAIEIAKINDSPFSFTSEEIEPTNYELTYTEAARGKSATGAPTFVSQADVLAPIANAISVRSDTFRIRSYGDVLSADGEILSRAWCEAIVQRQVDFVDPSDPPETELPGLNEKNSEYGRRFKILHFRWLTRDQL